MSIFEIHSNYPNEFDCIIKNNVSFKDVSNNNSFTLDKKTITLLKNNHRKYYKDIADLYEKNKIPNWKKKCENRIIKIKNAVITNTGIIITSKGVWKLGGCTDDRLDNMDFNVVLNYYRTVIQTQKLYDKIISIAAYWSYGIWHFPMEALVGLRLIDNFDNTYLHISEKNKFCLEWLNLYNSNLTNDKILEGTVFTKELLLPELGKCGNPYFEQIIWLKETIHKTLTPQKKNNLLILIKRNKKRSVYNHSIIEDICKNYCKKTNLEFYLHDDLFLPPVREQLEIFNKAKLIIGPHGGGGINLLTAKEKTYFIEFLNENEINMCYARMAYLLNINYFGITYSLTKGVDINKDLLPIFKELKSLIV